MQLKALIQKHRFHFIFLIISFLLYGNTLKNDFGLDDELVAGNKNITSKGIKAIPKIFRSHHVTDESGNTYEYRPMVKLSFAIESEIFGMNLVVSHFFNILLYALCLSLLFRLLKLVFREQKEFIIGTCVILFAFIPVHSEVVDSLKNRDVLLCFVFTISGAIQLMEFSEQKKIWKALAGFLFIFLAFLCKFDTLPYLLMIPLLVYQSKKGGIKYTIAVVVLVVVAYYTFKYTKNHMVSRATKHRLFVYFENPLFFEKTFVLHTSTLLNCMGFYLKMLFFPNKMSCFYGFNTIPVFSFTSFYALLGIASIPLMAWGFFKWFLKPNWYWYSIVFFGVSISMYLNYPKAAPGIVADRFMFFASVGFAIMLTQLIFYDHRSKRFPNAISEFSPRQKLVSIAVIIICSGLVITRNTEWKNKLVLFETDVKNYPESVKLSQLYCSQVLIEMNRQSGLVKENEKVKRLSDCETYLKNAIKIDSTCSSCYNNLSYVLLNFKNDPKEAIIYLKAAGRWGEERKELYCNTGIAYYRLNNLDTARYYLVKAIDLDKQGDFMPAYAALADVFRKSDIPSGITFFTKMVQERPNSEAPNLFLANLSVMAKDTVSGIKYYRKVVEINPSNEEVVQYLKRLESLVSR